MKKLIMIVILIALMIGSYFAYDKYKFSDTTLTNRCVMMYSQRGKTPQECECVVRGFKSFVSKEQLQKFFYDFDMDGLVATLGFFDVIKLNYVFERCLPER